MYNKTPQWLVNKFSVRTNERKNSVLNLLVMMKKRIVKISLWFIGILMSIFLLITSGIYFFKDEICGVVIQEINKKISSYKQQDKLT